MATPWRSGITQRTLYGKPATIEHMGVQLSGPNVGMTELLLYGANIRASS